MQMMGDVDKTAIACELPVKTIVQLAKDEDWDEKIRRVSLLARNGEQGGWERAQNRALCFVQAQRMRKTFDIMLEKMTGMNADELLDFLSSSDKNGHKHYSARFLADLTAAMEKTQFMSYAALGDTIKEREARGDTGEDNDAATLHAATIAALNAPQATFVPSDLLVKELAEKIHPPVTPAPECHTERKPTETLLDPPYVGESNNVR